MGEIHRFPIGTMSKDTRIHRANTCWHVFGCIWSLAILHSDLQHMYNHSLAKRWHRTFHSRSSTLKSRSRKPRLQTAGMMQCQEPISTRLMDVLECPRMLPVRRYALSSRIPQGTMPDGVKLTATSVAQAGNYLATGTICLLALS